MTPNPFKSSVISTSTRMFFEVKDLPSQTVLNNEHTFCFIFSSLDTMNLYQQYNNHNNNEMATRERRPPRSAFTLRERYLARSLYFAKEISHVELSLSGLGL